MVAVIYNRILSIMVVIFSNDSLSNAKKNYRLSLIVRLGSKLDTVNKKEKREEKKYVMSITWDFDQINEIIR